MNYAVGPSFSSSLTDTCGRWGDVGLYEWNVTVTEYVKGPILRPITATFVSSCVDYFGDPQESLSFEQPDGVLGGNSLNYGEADFEYVTF